MWQEYSHGKQTYQQLALKYKKSVPRIQQILDQHMPPVHFVNPQRTPLVIDATFFGRTSGVIVFRSPTFKKNLIWYEIESEKVEDYVMGIVELFSLEFEITGVTADGKPGVLKRLERFGLPVQMCHFHMLCIVTRDRAYLLLGN